MINKLASLANDLDSAGLKEYADATDYILNKIATEFRPDTLPAEFIWQIRDELIRTNQIDSRLTKALQTQIANKKLTNNWPHFRQKYKDWMSSRGPKEQDRTLEEMVEDGALNSEEVFEISERLKESERSEETNPAREPEQLSLF